MVRNEPGAGEGPRTRDALKNWSEDSRMIALVRLVLAASGLLTIYFIPSEPDRDVVLTYSALVLYTFYSLTVWFLAVRRSRLLRNLPDWGHWVDVAWFTLLITLSSGTNSIFFFGYFLPILVASFRWGFWSGIRVVLASTVLFTTLGYLSAPPEPDFEQQRMVIRPIYLLALGYMMSYWGGSEVLLKRRLALLREVGAISNPRFGVDRTLGVIMQRLMTFYDADGCSLVTIDPVSGLASLRRGVRPDTSETPPCAGNAAGDGRETNGSDRDPGARGGRSFDCRESEVSARAETIPSAVADLLLAPATDRAVLYSAPAPAGWRESRALYRSFAVVTEANEPAQRAGAWNGEVSPRTCEAIAAALDAQSFMTVPLNFRNRMSGRLYLTVERRRVFEESDARFLQQAIEHALPLVDNIRLVNQLASTAAEEERRKIARDIHDSVIQPYIGLQLGLAGVRQKLAANGSELCGDLERLMEMTHLGIVDLRKQVSALKTGGDREGSLLPALWRYAAKFADATGIAVHVEAEADLRVEDRLAAEAFQMVAEGLSNVRRHTRASHVTVGLSCRNGSLMLRIENDGVDEPLAPFTPRSISERAAALGGAARVLERENGATVVSIEVPL